MKKRHFGAAALFILCFSFLVFGGQASAKEVSVNKIIYVDTSGRLVLKFTDFSSKGYTYTVKQLDPKGIVTGTVKTGELKSGVGVLAYSLKANNYYVKNTKYQIVLTSKDKTKTLTNYYYTGTTLSGFSLSQQSDSSLKVSWKNSSKTVYSAYKIALYSGSNSTAANAAVFPKADKTSTKISASSLTNKRYYTYLIGYLDARKTDGRVYYGQGLTKTYDYLKKPAKVTGLTAAAKANRAALSWTPVSGASFYTVYKSTSSKSGFTAVKTNYTKTSLNVTGLTGGKSYYFKVVASSRMNSKTAAGPSSSVVKAQIPDVAGQTTGVKLTLNSKNQLALTWTRTKKATGYRVYYRVKGTLSWKKLGSTKNKIYTLSSLGTDTKYNLRVCAYTKVGTKTYLSSTPSKTVTVTPGVYMNKNYNKLLAAKVRTIDYDHGARYTTKKYSTEVKTAFVNYKGYSSKTKYLIWISHYTQQVSIFQGSKGKWKMIRTFICATGTAKNRSPRGIFKITYKQKGWYYTSTKELYVTHYCGRNSFHTRPLWNNGTVQNPTIGKPASHGCVRCYNQDAKYIYDKMPVGTTVVSY